MRLTVFAATLAFLLWGAPAFAGTAPDGDGDGISDGLDNCSDHSNPFQDTRTETTVETSAMRIITRMESWDCPISAGSWVPSTAMTN